MTILETDKAEESSAATANQTDDILNTKTRGDGESDTLNTADETDNNIFSENNINKNSTIEDSVGSKDDDKKSTIVSPDDKVRFIDSIIQNTRFTKDYKIFGGKVSLSLRSLTNDEVTAMSAWIINKGAYNTSNLLSGRYRKYLAAAQVEMLNGIKMPPLEEPLFSTIGPDGKTVTDPGWVNRVKYWDNMTVGLFGAIMKCIENFDALYSLLCAKAEDSNFWDPDTP